MVSDSTSSFGLFGIAEGIIFSNEPSVLDNF